MTYEDLERGKARKEAQMSGEGFVAGAGEGALPASRTGSDEPVRGSGDETWRDMSHPPEDGPRSTGRA